MSLRLIPAKPAGPDYKGNTSIPLPFRNPFGPFGSEHALQMRVNDVNEITFLF